jgi:ankyrin repeat protein
VAELHDAAFAGNISRVQQLLEAGGDDPHCRTALHRAAINGHASTVAVLLSAGAAADAAAIIAVERPLPLNGHCR